MRRIVVVFLSGVLITIGGCSKKNSQQDSKTILTSFYPIYISVLNIADGVDGVSVVNLTRPFTGCLHDYVLTPDDMKKIETASVFVVNGAGMESFLEKVVAARPDLKIINASERISFLPEFSMVNKHRNHAEHEHKSSDKEVESQDAVNPHVWVSISNAMVQVSTISEMLSVWDPSNADKYKANARDYIARLDSVKSLMHEQLAKVNGFRIITFHEAFPYFASEFGLDIVAVIQREPGSEPSAAELGSTIEIVKSMNVKALFAEPQYPAKSAEVVAHETGTPLFVLDPVVNGPLDKQAYISIMKSNLEILKKALLDE